MSLAFRPLEETLTKVIRDAGLDHQVHDDLVEWSLFAMREIGAYNQFEQKTEELEVVNYLALLPEDFYRVDQDKQTCKHLIRKDSVVVDFRHGKLRFHYLAFPMDEEGNILVPDESTYESAIQWYIYSRLALQGKWTATNFQEAEARWMGLKIAARGEVERMTLQQIQATVNDRMNPRFGFGTHGSTWNRKS